MTKGQRIIVTGAAGGIGAAAARTLAADGARVAAITHTSPLPADVAEAGDVTEHSCDIADRDAVMATFSAVAENLGGLDGLVHAAAADSFGPAADIDEAQLDHALAVNVKGTVWTNQAAFTHLRDSGGGAIINFVSLASVRGLPGMSPYAAAKGAVGAWTRTVSAEWGEHGVRVNALCPSMLTRMAQTYRASLTPEQLEAHRAELASVIHLGGEMGDPVRDCAPVIEFLLGDGGRFVTGQTIPVDGGWVKVGS